MPSSNPIQRYFPDFDSDEAAPNGQRIEMVADPDGAWIDWDDHLTAMQEVEKTLDHTKRLLGEAVTDQLKLERRAIEAEAEASKWKITSDAHCSVLMYAEDSLAAFKGLDVSDKAAEVKRLLTEFDAWLSFRGEFSEVLAALRKSFGTDTSAATLADSDPPEEAKVPRGKSIYLRQLERFDLFAGPGERIATLKPRREGGWVRFKDVEGLL